MLTPAELVWLIAAVAKGDEAAFERLYAATRAKLFGVVLRILRRQDLAEEVIQEAYVKIWNSAGQFNPGARFADHLDGVDRAQPGHRRRAQEERDLDRGGAGRDGSGGRSARIRWRGAR